MCLSLTVHAKVRLLCVLGTISKGVCAFQGKIQTHITPALKTNPFFDPAGLKHFFNVFIYCKATILHWNLAVPALRPLCIHFSTKAVLDGCVMLESLHHHLLHDLQLCALAKQSSKRIKSLFTNCFYIAHFVPVQLFCICCLCDSTLWGSTTTTGQ